MSGIATFNSGAEELSKIAATSIESVTVPAATLLDPNFAGPVTPFRVSSMVSCTSSVSLFVPVSVETEGDHLGDCTGWCEEEAEGASAAVQVVLPIGGSAADLVVGHYRAGRRAADGKLELHNAALLHRRVPVKRYSDGRKGGHGELYVEGVGAGAVVDAVCDGRRYGYPLQTLPWHS